MVRFLHLKGSRTGVRPLLPFGKGSPGTKGSSSIDELVSLLAGLYFGFDYNVCSLRGSVICRRTDLCIVSYLCLSFGSLPDPGGVWRLTKGKVALSPGGYLFYHDDNQLESQCSKVHVNERVEVADQTRLTSDIEERRR